MGSPASYREAADEARYRLKTERGVTVGDLSRVSGVPELRLQRAFTDPRSNTIDDASRIIVGLHALGDDSLLNLIVSDCELYRSPESGTPDNVHELTAATEATGLSGRIVGLIAKALENDGVVDGKEWAEIAPHVDGAIARLTAMKRRHEKQGRMG